MTNNKSLIAGVASAIAFAALGGFSLAKCTSNSGNAVATLQTAESPKPQADNVDLTDAAIRQANIATEVVKAGGLAAEIVSQAVVSPSPSGEAIVTARAAGAVTRVFKRLGDPVRAGEALAIVESRDAAQFAADRSTASAKLALARRALAREQFLFKERVSSRVELEQAQAEAVVAAAEARRAQASTGAANVTRDGRGVVVASSISGRVTSEAVSLGAYVQPETELFRVADPNKIQIEAAIAPADAQRITPGDRAIIELPDGRTLDAKVRSVTPTLNRETRSATAVLDVPPGVQPGLAVRVRLMPANATGSNAIVVPEDAVQSLEGRDVVFVKTAKGFRAATVRLGQRSAGRVEVLTGLSDGHIIAARNSFLLKAELAKGAGEEE